MSFNNTQLGAVKFYGPAILPLSSSSFGTHISQYGIGGFIELPNIASRNAIPIAEEMNSDGVSSGRRKLGMIVYTIEESKFFQLVPLSGNGLPVSFADWDVASDAQKMVWLDPVTTREDIYGSSPTFALINGSGNPNDCWKEIFFNAGLPVVGNFLPLSGGTITGDLVVDGSFMVNGSATFVNSTNLVIEDPLIFIAQNNPANLVDMGIVGQFINSPTQFTGLVRDHQTNEWYLFSGLSGVELTATDLDFTDPALKIDTLRANLIGDILSSTRVFGTLSASGNVYGNNLHWSEWDSTWTTVSANSAIWGQNVTDLQLLSSNWQSTYTTISANSATWVQNVIDLQSLSGNWQSTYTSVRDLSSNWESTYTTVSANSARWESAFYAISSTIFQEGNSFGKSVVIGSNDPYSLVFETSGTPRVTILSGGNVGIGTTNPNYSLTVIGDVSANAIRLVSSTANTLGIQFGTDTNLYRPGANRLKTDDVFECSLPANTTSNTVLVQAAANNAVNARSVSPTLWTVGDTVAGLSAVWNSTTTTVSANSAIWGQNVTDLRALSGNWQSTYTTVSTNSATWVQNVTDLQTLSGNWQSMYTTVSANSATWVQNVTDLQTLSGNWQSTYTTVEANSATWGQNVTDLRSLSGNWQSTYTTVSANSATWARNVTDLQTLSGNWQSTYLSVKDLSSNWESTYTTVSANSARWESAFYATSSTIFQKGNSFGEAVVIGSNDPYSLVFETSGTPRVTILSGGNVGIGTANPNHSLTVIGDVSANAIRLTSSAAATLGIQFGTDTNLYRPGANRLKTDDVFECSLPANTTSNTVLVQAAANNAVNARTVSSTLWTVGDTVAGLSAVWNSTTTTVSANSATWGQSVTDLRSLSGNWQSTYTTVLSNSATWVQNVTDLQTLSGNWQSTYTTISTNSATWVQNVTDLQTLSGNWQSTYTTVEANSSDWGLAFASIGNYLPLSGGTVNGDLFVNGNLVITGSSALISSTNIAIKDSLIYLGYDNPSDSLDIGFIGSFTEGLVGYQHTGLVRLYDTNEWALFSGLTSEPFSATSISRTDPTFSINTLNANLKGNILSSTNVFGSLSSNNLLYDVAGNSSLWNSTYTTVRSNSASWGQSATDLKSLSSNWQSTYTTVLANSASWTNLRSLSGNWQSTYTTVLANSASWTNLRSLSGNWQSTYTTVSANSASWGQSATDLKSLSGNWQSTYTTVSANSATWGQNVTDLQTLSGNWESTYTTVSANSARWESAFYATSSTIFQKGNSFGEAVVIGSNDPYSLVFETSGTPRVTILSGGNVGIGTANPNHSLTVIGDVSANAIRLVSSTANTLGIQFGTDTNLYRPGANRLKTDDVFECSLPANTTSNTVLVQAASNNAINARTVSSTLWTVGDTVAGLSAVWNSTTTTVSANSAVWTQGMTALTTLSGNWQSTYLTVSALSADWNDGTSEVVIARVFNADAVPLVRGHVVYTFGAQGDTMSVKLASNTSEATSSKTLGIVRDNIPVGLYGYVTLFGSMDKLNLDGTTFNEGDALWLGSVSGTYTNVKPIAPNHGVYLGVVERANGGNGIAYIKVQNGYELNEIHDVLVTSVSAGQILRRNSLNNLWTNVDDAFDWDSTYTTVSANSANWDNAYYSISSTIRHKGNSFGEAVVIGSNDPYSLVFETSGVPRVTILSGGNVGIGNLTPNYPLTVTGDISANAIRLTSSTANTFGIQFGTDTNLYRSAANILKTDDSFLPFLSSNGTSSNTVVVAQTTANQVLERRQINPAVWNTTARLITAEALNNFSKNYIPKAATNSSLDNSEIYQENLNIGIGTTTPNEKLTVVGSVSASDYVFSRTKLSFLTDSFTIQLSHQNNLVLCNNTAPISALVPNDSNVMFDVGASVNIASLGEKVYVDGYAGVTINAADNRNYLRTTNSTATILKIGANNWLLFGDIWNDTLAN